ncbi:IS110 family transposase [Pseudoalteromonas luteoviolacea]|uniref:IS110 family transposase n=1 Tax=Pseudoalteromonas luteoviolacea TaxID=43657 RepID=UPI001EED72D0|nr:IS110 family transposase [Pseudoalteromonas luteoviolacea]MCF6443094.1 IS110 family transposase [Pseudoalteromonas luteoviolacea]
MNNVSILSIDLAKNVFQLLGIDQSGKPCLSKRLSRVKLHEALVNLPTCEVVMEACCSSHYWGRVCLSAGHQVHLIPAQHVTPFVRGNKNDKNDCMAIYEASRRPNIRFVPVKTEQQQAILILHRMRERVLASRTACINQTRSLLLEFGIHIPKAYSIFKRYIHELLSEAIQPVLRLMLLEVHEELDGYDKRVRLLDSLFRQTNAQNSSAEIMQSIPGIGPTIASAFSASIDRGQAFKCAKDFSVWLGLTPKQYASGETNRLSGITKRGDCYLRKQLIHGARTVVNHAHKKDDDLNRWITALKQRRGVNKAIVATAHRLARLMWILLQKNEFYRPMFNNAVTQNV